MTTEYRKNGGISRTIHRPRLKREAGLFADRQALPPDGWCESCGGEVYSPGQTLCLDCEDDENGGNEYESENIPLYELYPGH